MKVSEIFNKKPSQWGLRGDPYLWEEMKTLLANTEMPPTPEELKKLIEQTYEAITSQSINCEKNLYIEKFAHGGMSNGSISPNFWKNNGIPILVARHVKS